MKNPFQMGLEEEHLSKNQQRKIFYLKLKSKNICFTINILKKCAKNFKHVMNGYRITYAGHGND